MNLTTLRTNVRNYLGDNNAVPTLITWPDAQLTLWINAAISSYSVHFPDRLDTTIDATAGARQYNLPYNVHGIISVEYQPLGTSNTPPTFYKPHDSMLADFYTINGVYDWRKNDVSSGIAMPSTILLNPATAANADTYFIQYNGDHPQLSAGADVLTVPDRHINLLYLYIRWCAIMELSTGVKRATYFQGDGGGTLQQPYSEIDLKRTLEAYEKALDAARKAESESVTIHWPLDKHGRVY
jgi:hypothetical protein